jgi:hypothetical protein
MKPRGRIDLKGEMKERMIHMVPAEPLWDVFTPDVIANLRLPIPIYPIQTPSLCPYSVLVRPIMRHLWLAADVSSSQRKCSVSSVNTLSSHPEMTRWRPLRRVPGAFLRHAGVSDSGFSDLRHFPLDAVNGPGAKPDHLGYLEDARTLA